MYIYVTKRQIFSSTTLFLSLPLSVSLSISLYLSLSLSISFPLYFPQILFNPFVPSHSLNFFQFSFLFHSNSKSFIHQFLSCPIFFLFISLSQHSSVSVSRPVIVSIIVSVYLPPPLSFSVCMYVCMSLSLSISLSPSQVLSFVLSHLCHSVAFSESSFRSLFLLILIGYRVCRSML